MPIPPNRFNPLSGDPVAATWTPDRGPAPDRAAPPQRGTPPAGGLPAARPGAGQGRGIEQALRRQVASGTAAPSHGARSGLAERMARELLASVRRGKLASEFNPGLLDGVHSLAYERDEQYDTVAGRMSARFLLAWLRGKHDIAPAQRRTSWAAAPAGLEMRAFDARQMANVESYGASVVGVRVPQALGGDGRTVGKTVFRDAADIEHDLNTLCRDIKRMLRNVRTPVEPFDVALIAAHFKQNFIAIHPYMDANGRVSRLVAERIFAEFDLAPPRWEGGSFDLDATVEDTALRMLRAA
jgi:hypothetical protein